MDRISRVLAAIIRHRRAVLAIYALLVPAAIVLALRIPQDSGIERLIVPTDPDVVATRAFTRLFPEPRTALLVFPDDAPFSPAAIARIDRVQAELRGIPHVVAFSVLDVLRRARPAGTPAELQALALGTPVFRQQGLAGPAYLTVLCDLSVRDAGERDAALAAIDAALVRAGIDPDGDAVREVGEPYASAWIEHQSSSASARAFPLFALMFVAIAWFLFRSWRALLALLLSLGGAVALAVAAGGLCGFAFTIVSLLVPLTILVTTLATLVYLHARFVDKPADIALEAHHVVALRNKFMPVTASMIAAAMGFAALAVSHILPIRELGIWTAIGLVVGWIVAFTLFPALQRALATPTGQRETVQAAIYARMARALPAFTYRWRWPLAGGAVLACAVGAALLFGIPGVVGGAPVQVDELSNLDSASKTYRDLAWFRDRVMQPNLARVWVHLPTAAATDPEVLHAIDRFHTALAATPGVTGVTGPTTLLRMRSYFAGKGDTLPADADAFASTTADFEQLLLTEPALRTFIDVDGLADAQLAVVFRGGTAADYDALRVRATAAWQGAISNAPAGSPLAGSTVRLVGNALLRTEAGASLVPTLSQSFAITAALIFVVFLAVFRSGIERLLAMIPSLFALLVAFLGMRVFGGSLNVATIIIATTVLGTTENDQIHFFHHMHERAGAPLEERLRHALAVSGRAIVFATLINVAGFLGLAVSTFPPLRQFGLMTSASFALALVADFTALPAALWLASRQRPAPEP